MLASAAAPHSPPIEAIAEPEDELVFGWELSEIVAEDEKVTPAVLLLEDGAVDLGAGQAGTAVLAETPSSAAVIFTPFPSHSRGPPADSVRPTGVENVTPPSTTFSGSLELIVGHGTSSQSSSAALP